MGNKVPYQGNKVTVTSVLSTPWILKAQVWACLVVLAIIEACSNLICKGSLEVICLNPLLKSGPTQMTREVLSMGRAVPSQCNVQCNFSG